MDSAVFEIPSGEGAGRDAQHDRRGACAPQQQGVETEWWKWKCFGRGVQNDRRDACAPRKLGTPYNILCGSGRESAHFKGYGQGRLMPAATIQIVTAHLSLPERQYLPELACFAG